MTAPPLPSSGLRVLVVDDNLINQRLAVTLLSKLGHTGVVVGDGEKALKCLGQLQFDVVLMDVMMPNTDGLQALQCIRKREQSEGGYLPVIMATSHNEPGDAARFKSLGADGFMPKPLNSETLRSELDRCTAHLRR